MKKNKSVIRLIRFLNSCVFVLLILGFGTQVLAADYYVSPTTTSTNWTAAQNISTPCTAETGLANAQPGDIVYFREGTYMCPVTQSSGYTPAFKPTNSGTSGNPITFKAYPSEIPFIDNSNNQGAAHPVGSFGVRYTNYIIWDGFHSKVVPGASGIGKGILLNNANHIIVRNCVVEGDLLGVSNNSCIRVDNVDDSTIENNKLYNSKQAGGAHHNSCGIMMYNTNRIIFQNNDIWDCDAGIFDKREGSNNFHRYNHIWDCNHGIDIGSDTHATQGIEVYQNVIHSLGNGIAISDADTSGCDGFKFYSNTFYNVGNWGISLRDATKVTNAEIFNNIIHTVDTAVRTYTGTALIIDHNDYYSVTRWNIDSYGGTDYYSLPSWQSATGFDMNSTISDPQFINPNGTSPEDYKLQSSSPALTLGIDRQDYDNDGNTTETIPAGAYITGNEIIGYTDTGTPDTTPPFRSNPQPTGILSSGTTSTNISLTTNETATCKYSETAGIDYDSMTLQLSSPQPSSGQATHSATVSNLSDGESKTYYIRCQDTAGNANLDDNFTISFSIASSTTYSISNFINLVTDWLKSESGLESDVNGDGVVNTRDLGIMMSNWQ